MSFGREKRLLLGWLALLAPLPLPLNQVLEWPVLVAYVVLVGLFMRRAAAGATSWLPGWAMNALGLAYLPLLYVDLTVRWTGQLVRPVIHIAMFAVVVKLFAMRRERDKWQTMVGVFFLFLAAMATSVHPSVAIYLAVALGLQVAVLLRFAYFSVLARFGRPDIPQAAHLALFTVAASLTALLLAAPLFAVLPRLSSPYIMGRGTGTGTEIHASGFTDTVTLDSIGSIRRNRNVVMRLRYDDEPEPGDEIRFKAATYEEYESRTWERSPEVAPLPRGPDDVRLLHRGRTARRVEVWLQPLRSTSLPVPIEALSLELGRLPLVLDRGGAVRARVPPPSTISYEVAMASDPVLSSAMAPVTESTRQEPTLDTSAVTPRMARLADQVMGEGTPQQRAARLESHLASEFDYTTDYVGRTGAEPLETFLFDTRSGHCEYFASAMVLLLRSQGIPSRLVTGYYGAERNRIEDYYVVRQSNAHAWVEGYLPESGWKLFDPTPAAGRPGSARLGFALFAQQLYDYLVFRWDRYVLTYGLTDQMNLYRRLRRGWSSLWEGLFGDRADRPTPSPTETVEETLPASEARADESVRVSWRRVLLVTLLGVAAVVLTGLGLRRWRRWSPDDSLAAYRRLRRELEAVGLDVPASTAPLALQSRAADEFPAVAGPTRRLVGLYLEESFAGRDLTDEERQTVRRALAGVRERLRRAESLG